MRLFYNFIRTDIRRASSRLSVEIISDFRQCDTLIDGVDCTVFQVKVSRTGIFEILRQVFYEIIGKCNRAVGFVPDSRPAQKVVGEHQPVVCKYRAKQPAQSAIRIVNGVIENLAVFRIYRHDSCLRSTRDEIISRDAADAMVRRFTVTVRIAELQADVTVDNNIALDNAVPRIVPDENGAPPLERPALNANKNIVAYNPVGGVHHVNPRDVIAFCNIRRVVAKALRSVVIKQAVLYPALFRPLGRAILLRDLHPFDTALPDIVNDTVIDGQVLDVRIGIYLKAVAPDVLYGQIRNCYAGAGLDADKLVVAALGPVDNHPLPPA